MSGWPFGGTVISGHMTWVLDGATASVSNMKWDFNSAGFILGDMQHFNDGVIVSIGGMKA